MNKRIKKKKQCASFLKENALTNQDVVIMRFDSNMKIEDVLEYTEYMGNMLKIYNLNCPILPEIKDKYSLFNLTKIETILYLQRQIDEIKLTFTEEDWGWYEKIYPHIDF